MQQVRLRSGDSFTMNFVLREDNTPKNLHSGEDIAIGFYSDNGYNYILKHSKGQIKYMNKEGYYAATIPSDISKNFVGEVEVEIVVYDSSSKETSHANKVLKINFEPRRINCEI